jgi:murein DD-endopeptidase MepM/ murein hydrolase activator NlpD
MRLLAILASALVIWLVTATQVPVHIRLHVSSVVLGAVVTQAFGCTNLELEPFDPSCPSHHTHTGIDLAARMGAEVFSATAGTVITGYDGGGAGNFVRVLVDDHVRILYCHLSAFTVATGDVVTPGELIGLVGASGLATGPHVHLQVDIDGQPVDPTWYLAS